MQDKAIAAIGEWQLEESKDLEQVDLYIDNMFPGKDYQMLLLVFRITNEKGELTCDYEGLDIEKVSAEKDEFKKFAYRKGSANGGDITFTTKISNPVTTKIKGIKEKTFKKILAFNGGVHENTSIFKLIRNCFIKNEIKIVKDIDEIFKNFSQKETVSTGMSFKIIKNGIVEYLREYDLIKEIIIQSGSITNYTHAGIESKSKNKISSVSGIKCNDIYGFAAPFKYSSPDKPGFISGFFNKKLNWRNYPVSSEETLILELGRKYIKQNLTGYFYGYKYYTIPHPIIKTNAHDLKNIIRLLKTAFEVEKQAKEEKKKGAEDRVQRIIAEEKNYFNLDLLFFEEDSKTGAISITLMLEEILPSRFRKLFIDAPEKINKNQIFKNAITIKKELQDLCFSYQILKLFFEKDFLDMVQKLFLGEKISNEYIYEHISGTIRKNYNAAKTSDGWVEPINWIVKKAIMLISYLQELEIINYNQNYTHMEIESTLKKESRFKLEGFNEFAKANSNFLDSDIKIGIFAVGVLVRFLYDIQSQSLNTSNPPFENKLKGYKLNPEILMNVYTEALDKIQKYQKNNYVYTDLREIINNYFIINNHALNKMSNNELSFYFVAGLEMGKQFKRDKQENQ